MSAASLAQGLPAPALTTSLKIPLRGRGGGWGPEPGDPRRRARLPGAEGGVPRPGRQGAARRHQEPQRRGQIGGWMAKAGSAEAMQEAVRKDRECVQMLLDAKTEATNSSTAEI